MNQKTLNKHLKLLIGILVLGVFFYIIYLSFHASVKIDNKRDNNFVKEVTKYNYYEIESKDAPLGIIRVFEWDLKQNSVYDNSIAFYIKHSYLKAYIDNTLVFSINGMSDNIKTVGDNYVMIPIAETDYGKKIRLEITPVYESFLNRNITLYGGSWQSIYVKELRNDLALIIISYSCIFMGLFLCVLSIIFYIKKRKTNDLEQLGVFAILLGIWKITDIRFTPLLFPNGSIFLSYLSLSSMFLAPVVFNMYIRDRISDSKCNTIKNICTILVYLYPIIAILLEIFKIMELRNALPGFHVIILVYVILLFIETLKDTIANIRIRRNNFLLIILFIGVLIDLFVYKKTLSPDYTFSLLIALMFGVSIMGVDTIKELRYQSYIDSLTGLYNNNRCKEIINNSAILDDNTIISVIDLNDLKYVNDSMGHDMGDKLIIDFATILYKVISKDSFVGRWGGDEFIVINQTASRENYTSMIDNLKNVVKKYNNRSNDIEISFSIGTTYSCDYENITMHNLFMEADKIMYIEKKKYHNKK